MKTTANQHFGTPWTDAERDIVTRHYPTMPRPQLMELLPNRSWSAITTEGRRMRLKRVAGSIQRDWRPDEDAILTRLWPSAAPLDDVCEQLPNRSLSAIRQRANFLGVRRTSVAPAPAQPGQLPSGWTQEEFGTLVTLYPTDVPFGELCGRIPGKSPSQIRNAAFDAGLRRSPELRATAYPGRTTRVTWTEQEDAAVLRGWKAGRSAEEIHKDVPNRTLLAIAQRARTLLRMERLKSSAHPAAADAIVEARP